MQTTAPPQDRAELARWVRCTCRAEFLIPKRLLLWRCPECGKYHVVKEKKAERV